jgi:hypothetical protein
MSLKSTGSSRGGSGSGSGSGDATLKGGGAECDGPVVPYEMHVRIFPPLHVSTSFNHIQQPQHIRTETLQNWLRLLDILFDLTC